MKKAKVSIVVPLFNESENFPFLIERLEKLVSNWAGGLEVVMVDDGSTDNTAVLMQALSLSNSAFQSIFLSRNFGHQIAVSAGLAYISAQKAVMVIDGDLQDPPELLDEFYTKLQSGYDVVYGVRRKRKENFLKCLLYMMYYRIQKKFVNIDIKLDSGDFCLMSRRVVDILNTMPEESRYIRGMRSWVGFKQVGIEYEREERYAGKSKYSFRALFKLAMSGIFNFSELPVVLIRRLGVFTVTVSLLYLIFNIFRYYIGHDVPIGFTGLLGTIILLGGVQLISVGILGEYIVKIFFQVKNRPKYIIDKVIVNEKINN